ncbi:MAG: NBR1-Ig-like domain-containing protein [Chloroflexota bacterium]
MRTLLPSLLLLGLLGGCLTIETQTPPPPLFVTSTLPAGPAATPTLTPTPEGILPRPEDCTDEAVLLEDVTIPDGTVVAPGEMFTKTWRLKNVGTCPWDARYSLVFLAGERMSTPDSVALTVTLPGESADVSVQLVAPSKNGKYMGIFGLRNSLGQEIPIGTSNNVWVDIVVGK